MKCWMSSRQIFVGSLRFRPPQYPVCSENVRGDEESEAWGGWADHRHESSERHESVKAGEYIQRFQSFFFHAGDIVFVTMQGVILRYKALVVVQFYFIPSENICEWQVDEDEPLFLSLISDLFPGIVLDTVSYVELQHAIELHVPEMGIVNHPPWNLKVSLLQW